MFYSGCQPGRSDALKLPARMTGAAETGAARSARAATGRAASMSGGWEVGVLGLLLLMGTAEDGFVRRRRQRVWVKAKPGGGTGFSFVV